MSPEDIYIARFSTWTPGCTSADEWRQWARGRREMLSSAEAPEIAFTDSLFRRRLSQISRMTIQVVHDLLPLKEDTKMIFLSFRGELSRQYNINRMQIQDKALLHASFSLSVFNAPPALASIALGLHGGYSALYPGKNSFTAGLAAVKAAFLCGMTEELVFVYADEEVPAEYASLLPERPPPFAFGLLLARESGPGRIPLSSLNEEEESPAEFLKSLILCGDTHVSS